MRLQRGAVGKMLLRRGLGSSSTYFDEIDGLRAIAVLSVILYHFEVPFLTGGFIGVDVFFVISGFLISRIILESISAGRFSFIDFYTRRAKRILPAMFVVVGATLITGYCVYPPQDFVEFRESAFFAATFLANLYYNAGSDYFAADTEAQPFLHFWSLAVEEQFYILWPALLVAISFVCRRRPAVLLSLIAVIGLISFIYGQLQMQTDPRGAFYLIFGRTWEFSLGAALVLAPTIATREMSALMRAAGVILIAISVLTFTSAYPYPGFWAIIPCLGAALIIWPAHEATSFVSRGLKWSPLRFVGLISYSAYLWHWPLYVITKFYFAESSLGVLTALLLLAITMVLAAATWHFIENPVREWRPQGIFKPAIVLGSFLLFAGGATTWMASSIPREWTSETYIVREQLKRAVQGEQTDVAFFGDSSCLTGIHPPTISEITGDRIASYCMFGSVGAVGDAAAISLLRERGKLPDKIILVIHPLQLSRAAIPKRWKDLVRACSSDRLCGYSIAPESIDFGRLKGAFTARYPTARELVREIAASGSLVDPSQKAFTKAVIDQNMPDSFQELQQPLLRALDGIDRSKVYLLIPPVPLGQSEGGFIRAKKAIARLLKIDASHVLNTPSEYPDSYFATRSHLTEKARTEFSKAIAEILMQHRGNATAVLSP